MDQQQPYDLDSALYEARLFGVFKYSHISAQMNATWRLGRKAPGMAALHPLLCPTYGLPPSLLFVAGNACM